MQPWRRLTLRGRVVVLVGALVAAAGILLAQRDLFWLGAFGFFAVFAALILVSWPIKGLRHERTLATQSVPVGTEFGVGLKLLSSRRAAARLLHFEDVVPPSMGMRPRFALSGRLSPVGDEVGYRLVGNQRGRYRLGPLLVRSLDPFGLAHNDMAFASTTEIAVTPRVHELGRLRAGAAGASAESHSARAGLVGQDDVLVREYRRGDDVRRVHWRSTARVGDLMVRREEQSWQPTTRLLIDNRRSAHAGQGPNSSFEWAVSAAASAGLALLGTGSTLELTDSDGPLLGPDADRSVRAQQLLDRLTDIRLTRSLELTPIGTGPALLAIMGRLTTDDIAVLLEAHAGKSTAHALVIDVGTFAGQRPDRGQAAAAEELAQRGWAVLVVDAAMTVPDAWSGLRDQGGGLG